MMKRKLLIGAFALVTALAATFAFESISGQNQVKANMGLYGVHHKTDSGGCTGSGDACIEMPNVY
jgi:uncharacterized membrane protein